MIIAPCPFHGTRQIAKSVLLRSGSNLTDCVVQLDPVMRHPSGRQQHLAVEGAQHPLGACLGGINGDNTEMLWADFLHARMHQTTRVLQELPPPRRPDECLHSDRINQRRHMRRIAQSTPAAQDDV